MPAFAAAVMLMMGVVTPARADATPSSCSVNLGTGQAPGVVDTASDPIWNIFDVKKDLDLGPAVPIGKPGWGAAPAGLHWIATRPGSTSGGNYPAGDYTYYTYFRGAQGSLSFSVKADNAVKVILNGNVLLSWGDATGVNTTGWASFSPVQTVTTGFTGYQGINLLELVVHNNDYMGGTTPTGVLLQGKFSCGKPAFIQSTFGVKGNFEVVAPYPTGGIAHYFRDNDYGGIWHGPTAVFGTTAGAVDAVSLIESGFLNLEVVARIGTQLAHFWRNSSGIWSGPTYFATGVVSGTPGFIQSKSGNFEVITPLTAGGMAHYSRVGNTWSLVESFATGFNVSDVSLIESSYGNLEVVARIGTQLSHFWRNSTGTWIANGVFANGVSGTPSLIQAPWVGVTGNFEVVTPLVTGGMAHYYRDNSTYSYQPWYGPTAQFGTGNVDGVALIQSNYGNLEAVDGVGYSLYHYYRNYLGQWSNPTPIP